LIKLGATFLIRETECALSSCWSGTAGAGAASASCALDTCKVNLV